MKTMKVSEFVKKFGGILPGTKLLLIKNVLPHAAKGSIMTVKKKLGTPQSYMLSGCALGRACYCQNGRFTVNDEWFEVLLEDEISDEDARNAKPLPDIDSVADDMRRMSDLKRRP